MNDFFLIGLGNIGRRHLQSCLNIKEPLNIHLYDIKLKDSELREIAQSILGDSPHKFSTYSNLPDMLQLMGQKSVVSLATHAKGRLELVKEILVENPKLIIMEKPLVQTRSELENLLHLSQEYQSEIRCNMGSRYQPYFQDVKKSISQITKASINIKNSESGLACAGVHYFDLFCWLFNIQNPKFVKARIEELYDSKRTGFQDLKGQVEFSSDLDSQLSFENLEDSKEIIEINLIDKKYSFDLLNDSKELKHLEVSQYFHQAIEYGLGYIESCELPTLKEASLSHFMLYTFLEEVNLKQLNYT